MFFATVLSAQVPNGTYVPCSDIAKQMYIEKVVFEANKVKVYMGTMGMSMGFEEYAYEVKQSTQDLPFVAVYFEYDKVNDILIFGDTYTKTMLSKYSNLTDGVKLLYNKSGNCNPNFASGKNNILIVIKDNNQDVTTEIINNYLIIPSEKDSVPLPRLNKDKARKSGKYTEAEITKASIVLRDEINIKLREIMIKINAANMILTSLGNNSAGIIDGILQIKSLFNIPNKIESAVKDPKAYVKGKLQDWFLEIMGVKFSSVGSVVESEMNTSEKVKSLTTILDGINKFIETLIAQNISINS